MPAPLTLSLDHPDLLVGWVTAHGVRVGESDGELRATLNDAVESARTEGLDEDVRAAIRDLLRGHGYKPSGRGKPASEFLSAAAVRGEFPTVVNVVDINNLVSLETGWPISVFDLDRARAAGGGLEVRLGQAGESFVFNPAGQSIDVGGLISVARRGGEPIGNPVKDSMETKVSADTDSVLAVLYTSRKVADPETVAAAARRLGQLLERHAGAESQESGVLPEGSP